MVFSVVLHVIVLGSLVRLADLAPAPGRFDVFAADPVDAAPPPPLVASVAESPKPSVTAPRRRPSPAARSRVSPARPRASSPSRAAVRAKSDPPVGAAPPARPPAAVAAATGEVAAVAATPLSLPDPPLHPGPADPTATAPVSVPSVAPAYAEAPLSSPESFAALDVPLPDPQPWTEAMVPGPAAPLAPVPAMPLTVVAAAPPARPLEGTATERPQAEPPESAPPTRALAAVSSLQPRSAPVDMPAPTPRVDESRAPEPPAPAIAAAAPAAAPEPLPPPSPPIPAPAAEQAAPFTPAVPADVVPSRPPAIAIPEPPAPAIAAAAPAPVPSPSPPIPSPAAEQTAPFTPAVPAVVAPSHPPAIANPTPPAPRRADARAASQGSATLGLGLGRLRIRLDGASVRTTDRETDVISGTLVGGQPERVVVQLDEQTSVPTLAGRAFATAVKLSPGVNRVRVRAIDAQGAEVEEVVSVQYVRPVTSDVAITSPRDGHALAPDDPPLVTVEGEVTDPGLSTVWIVANDRRVMVPVTGGRFRHVLPVLEATVRVRAETGSEGRHSATVTVDATAALPSIGLFLGDWPRVAAGPAQMTVTWRPNPAKLDGGAPPLPLRGPVGDAGNAAADFFYLRNARPGVYTFSMTYRAGATPVVRPVLSVAGAPRALRPVTLDGSGRAVVARLLLPQGVLWEQDEWFTGRSASGDTITKFRFPEGVSWIERLGNLGR